MTHQRMRRWNEGFHDPDQEDQNQTRTSENGAETTEYGGRKGLTHPSTAILSFGGRCIEHDIALAVP